MVPEFQLRLNTVLSPILCVCACAFLLGSAVGADASSVHELMELLLEKEGANLTQVRARTIEMGPKALAELSKYIALNIGKPDERPWKTAFSIYEEIIARNIDHVELDQGIVPADKPEVKTLAGLDFVKIPAGWFISGTSIESNSREEVNYFKLDVKRIWLKEYWISQTELSRSQCGKLGLHPRAKYRFCDDKNSPACDLTAEQIEFLLGRINASVTEGLTAQIPTHAQWEKAARGTDGRLYPWGNSFIRAFGLPRSKAVDLFFLPRDKTEVLLCGRTDYDTSPYGVKDMVGGVAELIVDREGEKDVSERLKKFSGDTALLATLPFTRGCGFFQETFQDPMLGFLTQAGPVGIRIVLVPKL